LALNAAITPLRYSYLVATCALFVVHGYETIRLSDAVWYLPGRPLVAWFCDWLRTMSLRICTVWIVRALACAGVVGALGGDTDRNSAYHEMHLRLRLGWLSPLALHLAMRCGTAATMRRLRRVVAEWGVDKETRGLAAMASIIAVGPCGSDWRRIAHHASRNFFAVPFKVLSAPFLGNVPLSAWHEMHLTGALLAPALDGVDAYISYTVIIILFVRLYYKTRQQPSPHTTPLF